MPFYPGDKVVLGDRTYDVEQLSEHHFIIHNDPSPNPIPRWMWVIAALSVTAFVLIVAYVIWTVIGALTSW